MQNHLAPFRTYIRLLEPSGSIFHLQEPQGFKFHPEEPFFFKSVSIKNIFQLIVQSEMERISSNLTGDNVVMANKIPALLI